jgi:ribosomal-protein-alanine acetyltransferase
MEPISTVRVRAALPSDLPHIIEIAKRSATAAQWSEAHYQQLFSTGRLVLVVEEAAEVAGFIVGRGAPGPGNSEEWEIENIAVRGGARRRGLASRLLSEFLSYARSKGARQVFLEVRESNRAARALYEKWAFLEAGRRQKYYQNPVEDALVLKIYFPDLG